MLAKISATSIHHKLLVGLLVAALVAWGSYSAVYLPLDAIPDSTNNQVQVSTQSPALAAQEVEQVLTIPLELQLRTVPGVAQIRSTCCPTPHAGTPRGLLPRSRTNQGPASRLTL